VEFHKHPILVGSISRATDLALFGLKHGLIALDPQPQPRALES